MQTVIGQFEDISRAQAAIDALLLRKYDKADISFLANDLTGGAVLSEARAPPGSTRAGAVGLLLGLVSVVVPSVGPVLAAGPLAVGLAGATFGGLKQGESWLGHTLGEVGVPAPEAMAYGEVIERGGALVLVRAREVVTPNISAILRSSGAVAVERYRRDPDS